MQEIIHYSLHFLAPGLLSYIFFREQFLKAWAIMLLTMLMDIDHLLATPVFDPHRCSIGFHPLHSFWAIGIYLLMFIWRPLRIPATGFLFHIFTDFQDCLWIFSKCATCFKESELYLVFGSWF